MGDKWETVVKNGPSLVQNAMGQQREAELVRLL
jgi:hypothetical protein